MKLPKPAALLGLTLLLLVGLAIGFEALMSAGTSGPESDEYAVRVLREGHELERFTVDELEEIGFVRLTIQGDWEEGPRLLDVLATAGVEDFERLRIYGMGVRDDGEIVLERDDVDDRILLDVAQKRLTVKVVGPDIPWEERVRDVTEITVE